MYAPTGDFEKFSIANNYYIPIRDIFEIPVQILPRGIQLCFLHQNTHFQMGVNVRTYHTLAVHLVYAPTGDFEKFSIAIIAISHTIHMGHNFKFQFRYFPEVYSSAFCTKTHLSRWESMYIPDFSCTPHVRSQR